MAQCSRTTSKPTKSGVFFLTKFGFAEGATAVTYVDNIRHYEGMLALQDLSNSWISPPIKLDKLLPPRLNETASPVL